jgi:hypothetical protein
MPAGFRNLFARGVGLGVRFGLGIVSSNLGFSWDAHNTILGSVLDEDLTMRSTSPLLGLSTLGNTAPMLSSGGTCGFILVDPRAADPSICRGIIGGGGARFCSKDPDRCTAQSHWVKVWTKRSEMSKGFYIINRRKNHVYAEPCLLFEEFLGCDENLTGVLDEENYNLDSCVTIMKALEVNGKAKGVEEEREEEEDERRTRAVVAVAKTPKRSGMGARMLDGDELGYGQQDDEEDLELRGWDFDFIQIWGEIGKRTPNAPYLSLHAGIEYALACVQTLEGNVSSKLEFKRGGGGGSCESSRDRRFRCSRQG